MEVDDLYRTTDDGDIVLSVSLQPGAGRGTVVGRHGKALKLRVAAPPEGGRANEAAARLLKETFGAAGADLVAGEASRSKQFRLTGLDLDEFRRRLERAVEEGRSGPGPDPRAAGRH